MDEQITKDNVVIEMEMSHRPFSVCMATYRKDDPENLRTAVNSIYADQTVKPTEIILVVDGPVPDSLTEVIGQLQTEISVLKVIFIEKNTGHAIARQTGVEAASNELVALMDADDVSVHDRFEKQLAAFENHPEMTVIGALIHEFVDREDNVVGKRVCPETDYEIKRYLCSRCPMNQVTVMFKKSEILEVGGYQDWYCEEDYFLWIRLVLNGNRFYNIQENLVNVRVGEKSYQRRGGLRYFLSEARLQKYMCDKHLITPLRYTYNVLIRFVVQVLMPNTIRGWVFQKFARSK